jgi:ligand-binding SRPBCC domain-containing protein
MKVHTLERAQRIGRPPGEVFPFFVNPRGLEAITPAWLRFRVVTPAPIDMGPDALIEYRLRLHGMPIRWVARIEVWEPERRFVDAQVRGPFRMWRHTHSFEPDGEGTLVRDLVRYALPLGPVGALAHVAFVRQDLEGIFDYRQEAVGRLLAS